MSIFKAYDIRGIYPSELNEAIAYKIGRAFADVSNTKKVIVGHDMRISSPQLSKALIRGLTDQGADVIDIGLCSTPMLYFASQKADAIMITASHNPKEYNGMKICRKGARVIGENSGLKKIERVFLKNKFTKAKKRQKCGKVEKKNILADYVKHVLKFKKPLRKLKIVMDGGNGMAGLTIPAVFNKINCKITPMHFILDGNFPNHTPNPVLPENIKDIKTKVKELKADIGIAFDGDMDRIVFIDEKGEAIPADITFALLAEHFLKRNAKIVYDLRMTKAVPELIAGKKGKEIISRVGHTFINQIMRKKKAVLGGELTGHYYFKGNFYCESADIAALLVLGMVSALKKPVSQIASKYKKYFDSGEMNFSVQNKDKVIELLKKNYSAGKLSAIDGITIDFGDWWFNARASQTEPLLRVVIEAKSKGLLEIKKREITAIISHN